MGLIQQRLRLTSRADYTEAKDVQAFIQALVNRESEIEWARREDTQKVPSRFYEKDKKLSFFRRYISQFEIQDRIKNEVAITRESQNAGGNWTDDYKEGFIDGLQRSLELFSY